MAGHMVYSAIVTAVRRGLNEPFSPADVTAACPTISPTTPSTFLPKHEIHKPGKDTKLFERVRRGRYKLLKPIRYGL